MRVVQYGLGPIGIETARLVLSKTPHLELVGAVDIDPNKAGKDVGEVLGLGGPTGIFVSSDAQQTFAETKPDVVLHTTSSFLDVVYDQLREILSAGIRIVSSTEELSYPWERHPEKSKELDRLAKSNGVALVGTGVNPGFALDTLVLTATAVCTDVRSLRAERVVDAALRRGPLQKKVGAGISAEAFEALKATGRFGHIGLRESLWMIGAGLGWSFDEIEESLQPVMAEEPIETAFVRVEPGQVAGIHHRISGRASGVETVALDLKMYVGAKNPHDRVVVDGTPPVQLLIENGLAGDVATVAMLVNLIPRILEAPPGLHTMPTLAVPRAFAAGNSGF